MFEIASQERMMTERKVADPSVGRKTLTRRLKNLVGAPADLPTISTLIARFSEGSIPLAQDFSDLINIAEYGRRAVGQSSDQADNSVGNGLALADNTNPDTMGKLSVKASSGITVDANGVSIDPNKVLPAGVIVMFSGTAIPTGWALCDGTSSTPDLRDRFILGGALADIGSKNSTALAGSATSKTFSASSNTVSATGTISVTATALSVDQMPAHAHNFTAPDPKKSGSTCALYAQTDAIDGEGDGMYPVVSYSDGSASDGESKYVMSNTGSGKTHTHSATFTSTSHSHTTSISVPYYVLAFIIKL
jgi:microcystin-dependent protein